MPDVFQNIILFVELARVINLSNYSLFVFNSIIFCIRFFLAINTAMREASEKLRIISWIGIARNSVSENGGKLCL